MSTKKVVLVTGASGYLGGRLCYALLNQGYSVRAFVRKTSNLSSLPPPTDGGTAGGSLQLVYGDVTDYPSLLEAFSGCDVVFHAAALVEPWIPDPSRFYTVNVGGLRNVVKAYKETKAIEKIIYTSSFFALGSTDGYIADETQVHSCKFFCTEYEKSKAEADKIALDAADEGVPIVPVYPGVIYGPGKVTTGNIVAHMLVERFNWRLPGYAGHEFSFSHIDDVVQGHIAAMIKGKQGERYLLTGENASFKDIFDLAAEITHTSKPRFRIPLFLLRVVGWLCVIASRITGNLPLISPPSVNVLGHQWAYSCEKAKRELDYNPRSLKEGNSSRKKMVMSKVKYEVIREKRLAENRKRMEELHLPLLSQALRDASSPKPSPMKKTKPRVAKTEIVPVRRSLRFSNKSAPQYKEITTYERVQIPRRITPRKRDLSNRVYASDEARECAIKKAEEMESSLGSDHPTFVKSMLPSHVSGGFWLGLSSYYCKRQLPRNDGVFTLVDEQGEEWPVVYLARKCGLSGGWKKFSVDHGLVDGDALVFQLIRPSVLKIFIVRVEDDSAGKSTNDETNMVLNE